MNNTILTRDSFVTEVYSKQDKNELNEGIFDFFKTLMKKEWNDIKSKNADIKKKLEEVDRGLKGFTLVKMKKSGACAEIRQQLCDFANTLWESKEKELEDGMKLQKMLMGLKDKDKVTSEDEENVANSGKISDYMKQFNVKDKALADKLSTYEKRINQTCKGDPDLTRWTDILKSEIRNIVNDMVIDVYDKTASDEEKKKAKEKREILRKQQEEQKKAIEKKDKENLKKQEDAIKKIEKERETSLSNIGISPIKNQSGDKAFNTLNTSFNDILGELGINESYKYSFNNLINESKGKGIDNKIKQTLGGDTYFGLNKIEQIPDVNTKLVNIMLKELSVVFNAIDKISKKGKLFKDVPSDAVQALYVGLTEIIVHALSDDKIDDNVKTLLARCAIDSDKTLGYGLPLVNDKKPDEGNVFVAITKKLTDAKDEAGVFNNKDGKPNKELLNKFKQNITKMFDEVRKTADTLKEEREKENEKESDKAEKENK